MVVLRLVGYRKGTYRACMTEAIAFDTHRFVKRLTESGFSKQQAETLADEHVGLLNANLATKDDLAKGRGGDGPRFAKKPGWRRPNRDTDRVGKVRTSEMDDRRTDRPRGLIVALVKLLWSHPAITDQRTLNFSRIWSKAWEGRLAARMIRCAHCRGVESVVSTSTS